MAKKKSLYIKGTFFTNKALLSFDDDVVFKLGIDMLTLEDFFHDTHLRSNLLNEGQDDTNQVKSEFCLKMSTDQFCKIRHISQTVYWIELKFYKEMLDTINYIMV